MEVIAGTYSHLIFGYNVKPNDEQKLKFSTSFTNDSHAGVVKCVAVNRKGFMASGSADESIRLFSLKGKRSEIGSLCQHNGSVLSLKFFKNSHLFSASEDGTIAIWKVGTWDCLKLLKHKEAVVDFAIHPSGKLLLSTTKDRTLQTWNLLSGRRAFVTNVKQVGEMVQFSCDGDKFVVVMGHDVNVYSTETAKVLQTISHTSRISSITFLNNEILLVGDEEGVVNFFELTSFTSIHRLKTNTIRVKGIHYCQSTSKLFIASSDGYIKLYDVHIQGELKVTTDFVTGVVTPHRWLCMTAFDGHDDNDDGDDAEDEEEDNLIEKKILKNKQKNLKKNKSKLKKKMEDEDNVDDDDAEDDDAELEEDDGEDMHDDEDDDQEERNSGKKRKFPALTEHHTKKRKFNKVGGNEDNGGEMSTRKVRTPWKQSKNKLGKNGSNNKLFRSKSDNEDKFMKNVKNKKKSVKFADDDRSGKKKNFHKNNKFDKFKNRNNKSFKGKFDKKQRVNKRSNR